MPALVAIKLLKPLGNPAPGGIKFFDAGELLELAKDHVWLIRVTNAFNQYWRNQNAEEKINLVNSHSLPTGL